MATGPDARGNFDPIDRLIDEVRAALEARLFTAALISTLSLVDMCGALASPDGRSTGEDFRAWFSANVPREYAEFDARDAWDLRCGLLHQGHAKGKNYATILFTLPDRQGNVFHSNHFEGIGGQSARALNLDLCTFVLDLLDAIGAWWRAHQSVEPVAHNAKSLARIRLNGMAPYMTGMPLFA
jgi:hypothetical protein